MYDLNSRMHLATVANNALTKLNRARIEENSFQRTSQTDFSRQIFEEYDDNAFENKVKLDSTFYRLLLNRLDEQYTEPVQTILTRLLETVKEIYEHVNVKPKLYGFTQSSLNESDEVLENTGLRIINDFINQNYYSLTSKQREKQYLESVKPIATGVILEDGVNEEEAVRFATKTIVMQNLLEKINFPMSIKYKVEELLSDDNYAEIFEQNRLREIWDQFQDQSYDIARIVATVI